MKPVSKIFSVLAFAGAVLTFSPSNAEHANSSKESANKSEVAHMHMDIQRVMSRNVKWQINNLHFTTEVMNYDIHYKYKTILYKHNREADQASQISDEIESANTTE